MTFSWQCPYCFKNATITNSNYSTNFHYFDKNNIDGFLALETVVITCPNDECKEYSIHVNLNIAENNHPYTNKIKDKISNWKLKPSSSAKPLPDYVPSAIKQDYEESCLIADLSPKASATLSRRCLQGMIRDFWGIKKKTLFDEIIALEETIDPITWRAIDAVRKIGNIGAHMEKDINVIVDVDKHEAVILINLIESLIAEWYISKHEREKRMQEIIEITIHKEELKKA